MLVWRSVQSERPPPPPAHETRLAHCRTLASIISELRCALCWLVPPDGDEGDGRDDDVGRRGQLAVPSRVLLERMHGIREQLHSGPSAGDVGDYVTNTATEDAVDDNGEVDMRAHEDISTRIVALVTDIETALKADDADGDLERRAGRAAPLTLRLLGSVESLHDDVQKCLKEAANAHKVAVATGWRTWVSENIANGAKKNAHKFLRLHSDWRPTTKLCIDGITSADPRKLLDGYVHKYNRLWNGAEEPTQRGRADQGHAGDDGAKRNGPWRSTRSSPLPRPTPAQLRAAAMSFSAVTMVAFDGFALRHYALMSDVALGFIADFIEILEITGELPPQLGLTAMPLIEKARGGHRAVASLVGLYRLWARLRKPIVGEWESRHERPYLAAGKGKSPQATVWRQACRSEAAVGRGMCSGTVLWDMASFFEAIKRVPLWHRARKLGFPLTILKVALTTYEAVRMLSMGGAMSAPMHSEDGVLAGCGFAMALTRAYVVPPLDIAVERFGPSSDRPADFDLFVDDAAISAEGTMTQVVDKLVHAAGVIRETIEGPLHCAIEQAKAAVVSSNRALTEELRRRFGIAAAASGHSSLASRRGPPRPAGRARAVTRVGRRSSGRSGPAVVNLGIDYSAGGMRRDHGVACKRKKTPGRAESQDQAAPED